MIQDNRSRGWLGYPAGSKLLWLNPTYKICDGYAHHRHRATRVAIADMIQDNRSRGWAVGLPCGKQAMFPQPNLQDWLKY
ncbi:MAG TPA: hypothetical protein DEG17_18300 [Cyanobacteria bacterium UBA11149]|nr:hypothetical protein [Cyanobacteria bacterium UBA11367]HBE58441.1 hypothetical protein [Cyanobacteria bacterium UBA11366]HBK65506.1 hypothetical protein [Cyanobacteria bacterium UBA11166]HBR73468.1 hypothetical protein [Cyanobacteria bacterium UBA11159]HBS71801.1 hypothetical protein [Cyanobacteria bacterium UBA11153]HBW90768.1 hypothetical protein [Cyanobacteria bacterium UBA11149]HCA94271.1 hypothetical protein [Cyanobacteria bacterium UBA9226]